MSDVLVVEILKAVGRIVCTGPVTLMRSYVPRFDVANIREGGWGAIVMPRGIEATPTTRGQDQIDVFIDVGIIKPNIPDIEGSGSIEGCFRMISRLNKNLRVRLDTDPPASWIGRKCDPLYDVEKLQRDRVFYSVTTHTYRVFTAEPLA